MKHRASNIFLSGLAFFFLNAYFLLWFTGSGYWEASWHFGPLKAGWFFTIINGSIACCSFAGIHYRRLLRYLDQRQVGPLGKSTTTTLLSVFVYGCSSFLFFGLFFSIFHTASQAFSLSVDLLRGPLFGFSILFYGFISLLLLMTANLEQRLGSLMRSLQFLFGKFTAPRAVNQGFLFIDMNRSTQAAEHLGHERYAALLHRCFQILGDELTKSPLELYQYVGDEAVLTWELSKEADTEAAVQLFFRFKERLQQQKQRLEQDFGWAPSFKGATHGGEVIASEMRNSPPQLIYHGDVLNTTARMVGLCHTLKVDFLASEIIQQQLAQHPDYQFKAMKSIPLRGKKHPVQLYKINLMSKQHEPFLFFKTNSDCQSLLNRLIFLLS